MAFKWHQMKRLFVGLWNIHLLVRVKMIKRLQLDHNICALHLAQKYETSSAVKYTDFTFGSVKLPAFYFSHSHTEVGLHDYSKSNQKAASQSVSVYSKCCSVQTLSLTVDCSTFNQVCKYYYTTFTFMHLADAFIQSDLQCIQVIHIFFCVSTCVPWESNPQPFALLTQCSNH